MRSDVKAADFDPSFEPLAIGRAVAALHPHALLVTTAGTVEWISERLARALGSERGARPALSALFGPEQGQLIQARLVNGRLAGTPLVLREPGGEALPVLATDLRLLRAELHASLVVLKIAAGSAHAREIAQATAMLEHIGAAAAVVDAEGFVLFANARLVEELDFASADEMVQRPLGAWLAGRGDLERAAELLRDHGPSGRAELSLRRPRGDARRAIARSFALLPESGASGTRILLFDWAPDAARGQVRAVPSLPALAHDLRSPLAAVLGFARLAGEELSDGSAPRIQHLVSRIEQSARTMAAMIDAAQRAVPSPDQITDPLEVLLQLHAELKSRLDARHIRLLLPEDPPQVSCDRTQLYRLLTNLLVNAIDHMGEPRQPRIEVAIARSGAVAQLCVRDNGVGIEPEQHELIFQRAYSRAAEHIRRSGCAGLGLAIVREIAATWQGRAWVESQLGAGAAFYVTVPLAY